MIKKIILKNIQCHSKLVIKPDPGWTIICGDNNAGKSTIMRAVKWFFTNRPMGDWMIKDGEEECYIKILTEEHVGKRTRGKGVNSYDIDGEDYIDVRGNVPTVLDSFGFIAVALGNKTVYPNFGLTRDDEELFMVPFPGPVKYGMLSYLTECHIVSTVTKEFATDRRRANATVAVLEEQEAKIGRDIKDLPKTKKAREEIQTATRENEEMVALEEKGRKLQEISVRYGEVEGKAKLHKECLGVFEDVPDGEKVRELLAEISKLKAARVLVRRLRDKKKLARQLSKDNTKAGIFLGMLQKDWKEMGKVDESLRMIENLRDSRQGVKETKRMLGKIEKKLEKFSYCPTCGVLQSV